MNIVSSAITTLVLFSIFLVGCDKNNSQVKTLPSGESCTENIAYLQWGVDKYFKTTGKYPASISQLAVASGGEGPFVEGIPKCPSGSQYVISNGKVIEAH